MNTIDFYPQVTIKTLRDEAPEWSWTAKRHGFGGWRYYGKRDDYPDVEVYAVGVIVGPLEDDIATQWRIRAGDCSWSLWAGLIQLGSYVPSRAHVAGASP